MQICEAFLVNVERTLEPVLIWKKTKTFCSLFLWMLLEKESLLGENVEKGEEVRTAAAINHSFTCKP